MTLEVPDWGSVSWSWSGYDHWSLVHLYLEFWVSILILKVQRTSMSFNSSFGSLEDAGGSWLGLASWSLFWNGHRSLIHKWSKFWVPILILKVQRTSTSFKSPFGALEDAGDPWLGFGILILIWIWSLVFGTSFLNFSLYIDFEGARNIHVLKVLILGFGGFWQFLTRVWHLGLDLDMVSVLWYTYVLNFGFPSWFWRCKEHPCPLSPHLGL